TRWRPVRHPGTDPRLVYSEHLRHTSRRAGVFSSEAQSQSWSRFHLLSGIGSCGGVGAQAGADGAARVAVASALHGSPQPRRAWADKAELPAFALAGGCADAV